MAELPNCAPTLTKIPDSVALDTPLTTRHAQCKNCLTLLLGAFCHVCGQKEVLDQDRRLRHLVELFIAELVSLDGKFWRSLRGMFKPGFLAREYLQGRRVPYLSPVSIFLLVNVLYFLVPVLNDFDLPFSDQMPGHIIVQLDKFKDASPERKERIAKAGGQLHSSWSVPWVQAWLKREQAIDPSVDINTLARRFDSKSGDISKLLIVLHVPFLALALMLMFWRKKLYFAEHFVVALVLFASILFAVQLIFPIMAFVPMPESLSPALRWLALIGFTALIANALRRIYQVPIWYSLFAAASFLVALTLINLTLYRSIQFAVVFALC